MPRNSQLSRWGAISKIVPGVAPSAKVFFVGDSDDTGFVDFVNEFPADEDGVVRVFSSMFDSTMLANLRASRGDVVLVMPGHSESITSDQAITVNGARFIGLGEGDNRPLITFDDTGSQISLDTAAISLDNFRLQASVTGITRAVDVPTGSHGCVVRNCSFEFDATGDEFNVGVRATGADRVVIEDNRFIGEDTQATATDGILVNNGDFAVVRRNFVGSSFTNSNITFDSDASLGILVEDNKCLNQDTDAVGIRIGASTTGLVIGNYIGTDDTAAAATAQVVLGGAKWFENYVTGDSDHGGVVTPATST